MEQNIKLVQEFGIKIQKLKDLLRSEGIAKEKTANYGMLFSEAQILDFTNKHSDIISFTWVPLESDVEVLATGAYLAKTRALVIATFKSEQNKDVMTLTLNPSGPAGDRNNPEFAVGKAQTYLKRYFFTKLLDLAGDDIEPEDAGRMKKELTEALKTRYDELEEVEQERFLAALKKHTSADSLSKLASNEQLMKANAIMDKLVLTLKLKKEKEEKGDK